MNHTPTRSISGVSTNTLAKIYAEAAAWLERNPDSDADIAIGRAATWRSFKTLCVAKFTFRDSFGALIGNDDGVTMLCFASALASEGDLS